MSNVSESENLNTFSILTYICEHNFNIFLHIFDSRKDVIFSHTIKKANMLTDHEKISDCRLTFRPLIQLYWQKRKDGK